ncbi:MAG: hypothetical protein NT004_08835 [Bacteroidetes bacterium]|nr:hypothetical protein [Bacteroidota bacterium]
MKKIHLLIVLLVLSVSTTVGQVGINIDGDQPDPSSMLDVKSSNKGVLLPRITFFQRNAITTPAEGLLVFCNDCGTNGALSVYSNGAWRTYSPCENQSPNIGINIVSPTQIIWNWNPVPGATGYKWNATDNYGTAYELGSTTSKTETGLSCNTSYTRYAWSYNGCGFSAPTTLNATTITIPAIPFTGTHAQSPTQIIWNWNSSAGASGYKWNITNDYGTATDMGIATTKTETGLNCNTPYTRYIWAYNICGISSVAILTQTTAINPNSPGIGVHIPSLNQIVWKWVAVLGASGYKWNMTNDYATALDLGTSLLMFESGLTCNSNYTRYVWAYSDCGNSTELVLNQSTLTTPINPTTAGTHIPSMNQIIWKWNTVPGATGYKWNTTDNYSTAVNMGTNISKTETGLSCTTTYTRYLWVYNICGISTPIVLTQSTSPCFPTVLTTMVTNITQTAATGGGNVTSDGGATVTLRGVCWSTTPNPTITDSHTIDGNGVGTFITNISMLVGNTQYYIRAYATNSMGTSYGNEVSFLTLQFFIGQSFGGGRIFYLDGSGQHGLVCATSDQSINAEWGCFGTSITGTSSAFGMGQANTTAIVNGCSTAGIAARICDDLVLNGYNDWFLPSLDELYQMYLLKVIIGGFTDGTYWSSCEYYANTAHNRNFSAGNLGFLTKDSYCRVRAIRAF